MTRAISPTGSPIAGTVERIIGLALIDESGWTKNAAGKIEFEYAGETEVDWNSQVSVLREGKVIYEDEQGQQWSEDELTLVEED